MLTGERISVTLKKGHRMILTISNTKSSSGQIVNHIYQILYTIVLNSFWEINCLSTFQSKSITSQSQPCHKLGHGQPKVIIWANYDGPQVLNTTYKVSRSLTFWFWRRFLKGFYHIWEWQPFWSCDLESMNNLSFPNPTEAPYNFGFDRPSIFRKEVLW